MYQPEMFSFEELKPHFKITKSEYDRIVIICKLLDELLQQKLEFEIAPYEKENTIFELI